MAKQWQIQVDGSIHGPFSAEKLRQLVSSGKINQKTPIRASENSIWVMADRIPGLFPDETVDDETQQSGSFESSSPPSKTSSEKIWHIARSGKQTGPFTFEQLKKSIAEGVLRPTDLVWEPGRKDWEPASAVIELFPPEVQSTFQNTPPPVPGKSESGRNSPTKMPLGATGETFGTHTQSEERKKKCPMCKEWILESAIKCRFCGSLLVPLDGLTSPHQAIANKTSLIQPPESPYSPVLIGMLSGCCIAGLGHIVVGQAVKGIVCLIGAVVFALLTHGLSAIITWPLMGIDAYLVARKLKSGRPVTEWESFPT